MTTDTYRIHEANREGLEASLAKLARRASRLGVVEPIWNYSELITVNEKDGMGFRQTYWYDLTLTSEPVKLAGWTLVGTIDHTTEAGVVLRSAPCESIPSIYRDATNNCDHCNTNRRRIETFVVRNDEGQIKQVGRKCLRDFLGMDPRKFANLASFILSLSEAINEAGDEGSGSGNFLSMVSYVGYAACAIRSYGWTSRAKARDTFPERATADDALNLMLSKRNFKGSKDLPDVTPEDVATAEAAIKWAVELSENESLSDYEYNVNVVARSEALNFKNIGLAASIVFVYSRTIERENLRKNAAETSEHFGDIKVRALYTLTLNGVMAFDGNYGPTFLHTFTDADGNVAKWFGSRELDAEIGDTIIVKATVKAHDEYKGVKQTMLTRVTEAAPRPRMARNI